MDVSFLKDVLLKGLELLVAATFPSAVFVISADVTLREFGGEFRKLRLFLKTFVVASLLVPLLTAGIIKLFAVPLQIGAVILVAGMAPGDSFALLEAKSKRGNINLAAATMSLLCFTMPLTVPVWLWLFSQWFPLHLAISPLELFLSIAPITILPLVAGMVLRTYRPSLAAILKRILEKFFQIAMAIVSVLSLVIGIEGLTQFTWGAVAAIFVMVSLALICGYSVGGSNPQDRISLALTASLGNLAVVFLIAHLCYPQAHVLGIAVAFSVLRWFVILFWHGVLHIQSKWAT